jgi:hypothetical protein
VHLGRRQTRQHRVLQLARDTPTGRHKARTGRGRVVGALAPPGHSVREIVDARAGAPVLLQDSDRLVSIAAPVFEVGGWSPHRGAKAAKPRGHRVARPGGGDSDSKTGDAGQSTGRWPVLRVLGSTGQDGHNLARAQAKAASNQPDETMTAGAARRGRPRSRRAASPRTMASRVPPLRTVCGHGAFVMPQPAARSGSTRDTVRKLIRTSTKRRRASHTRSTLWSTTSPWAWASCCRKHSWAWAQVSVGGGLA